MLMRALGILFGGIALMMLCSCGLSVREQGEWGRLETLFAQLRSAGDRQKEADVRGASTLQEKITRRNLGSDWGEAGRRPVLIQAQGEIWIDVVRDVCRQAGLSLIAGAAIEGSEQLVTMSLDRCHVREALERLGDEVDLRVVYDRGVVTFKERSSNVLQLLQPGYLSSADAQEVLSTIAGDDASVRTVGQAIVIAGDDETVGRAGQVGELLAMAQPGQWVVTVWVLEIDASVSRRLGVAIDIGGTFKGMIGGEVAGLVAEALLSGIVEAERSERIGRVLNHGRLVLLAGQPSSLQSGQTVPIPQRTVTPQGTIQTSGYSYVDVGLLIDLSGREIPGGLMLSVTPEISSVTGFVDEAPIVTRRTMTVNCMVRSNEWIVLAGLGSWSDIQGREGILSTIGQRDGSFSDVLVVLRADKMSWYDETVVVVPADLDESMSGFSEWGERAEKLRELEGETAGGDVTDQVDVTSSGDVPE